MSARLGLAVGGGEVRAALVRDGRVVWTSTRPVGPSDALSEVVAATILSAPLPRYRRTPVVAALGPSVVQVKRLTGVAQDAKRQVVTQLVRSNVGRFFLRNGVPLSVAPAHRAPDGWWGAVMETPSVSALEEGCSRSAVRFEGCVPAVSAIARGASDGVLEYADGPVRARITVAKGQMTDIRRELGVATAQDAPAQCSDAAAAALSTERSPLFLRATPREATQRQRAWMRAALALLVALALAAALLASGAAATRSAARDAQRLDALRGTLTAWGPALYELRQATAALGEVGDFGRERRSTALLLGAIAATLPDSTAIVTFRLDSAGGAMTLLSQTAAAIVPRISAIPEVADARIVGAVTRENSGGRQLQRISLRFRLRAPERTRGSR